jgi:hypothetical protein
MKFAKGTWLRLGANWRIAITAFLVARVFYAIWSWVILGVQPVSVHYIDVGGKPAVIFLNLYNIQSYTYFNEVNGTPLNFRAVDRDTVVDLQTGSVWEISTGIASEGNLQGTTLTPTEHPPDMFPYHGATPYPNAWLGLWQRFDTNWYTTLAENGYGSIPGDDHYPPLYPLLIRLAIPLFGNSFLAGWIISNILAILAFKLLVDLFNQWGAPRTVFYYLIFPSSFFLFAAYSEPLFLATTLLSLRAMQGRNWAWAGFWTFCAISARLQGAALLPVMVYLMWLDGPFLKKIQHWAGLGFAGSALVFYLFLRSTQVTDNAVPFSEPDWHARLVPPWETYLYAVRTLLSGKFNHIDFLNWFIGTLMIVLLIVGWKRIPMEYNLFTVFSLLIILIRIVDTRPLISMSRYALTLFPVFFTLALVDNSPWGRRVVIYTSIALNLFLSAEFFGWGWVA